MEAVLNLADVTKSEKQLNLFQIFIKKEKKFWLRTFEMKKKIGWIGFIIALLFILFGRICFISMFFLSKGYLWIRDNKEFKQNLIVLQKTI